MVAATLVTAAAAALSCAAAIVCFVILGRVIGQSRLARVNADEIALCHTRIDNLASGIKRVEGRLVKAAQRSKTNGDDDGPPDPKADPDGWKLWQNRAIVKARSKLQ